MSLSKRQPTYKGLSTGNKFDPIERGVAALMLRYLRADKRNSAQRADYAIDRTVSGRRTYTQTINGNRNLLVCESPNARLTRKHPALAAEYGGGMAVTNVQHLMAGQRKQLAQGISYNFWLDNGITDAQVLALLQIKDMLRRVGMAMVANDGTGRIVFVRRAVGDQRVLASSTFV